MNASASQHNEAVNDGGPAFPGSVQRGSNGDYWMDQSEGMTLRDWFAGQASEVDIMEHQPIMELRLGAATPYATGLVRSREAAKYRYADAMIAERERGNTTPHNAATREG